MLEVSAARSPVEKYIRAGFGILTNNIEYWKRMAKKDVADKILTKRESLFKKVLK